MLDVPSDLSSVAAVYTEVATNELSTTATGYEADEYLVTEDQTRLRNEQRAVEATLPRAPSGPRRCRSGGGAGRGVAPERPG